MPADTTSADTALHGLADAAGPCVDWVDASDQRRRVAPPTLRAVLESLGLRAGDDSACNDSLERLRARAGVAPMLTVDAGQRLTVAARRAAHSSCALATATCVPVDSTRRVPCMLPTPSAITPRMG